MEELIGDDSMGQALMELMELIIQEKARKELKQGIQMTIDILREFGHGDAEIKDAMMRKYDISAEEVEGYFCNPDNEVT